MPYSDYIYDVFISYNHTYMDWVHTFATDLKRRKFKVFFDKWEIRVGESIPAALRRGLSNSRYIIFIMTPEWINSEWCQLEGDTTITSDPSARRRRIIPLLLKDCQIPEDIARLKCLDFRNPNLYREKLNLLVGDLRNKPSYDLLEKIVEKQRSLILNFPVLPWTPENSPSFDFLWPELFIEPKIKSHKHYVSSKPLYSWVNNYDWKSIVAIVGPPGIGKTTSLRAIFLKFSALKNNLQYRSPFILTTASEVLDFMQSGERSLIVYLIKNLGIQIPERLIHHENVILFVDGLDEVAEDKSYQVLTVLKNTYIKYKKMALWLACRKEFFFRNIAIKSKWNVLFYDILELLDWDENEDSLKFAAKYSEKMQKPFLYQRLLSLKQNHPEISHFLRNPFELTLLLYLLTDDEKTLAQENLLNSYALYNSFYENWIEREHHRGTASLPPDTVSELHHEIAMMLYSSKELGTNLNEIITKVNSDIPLNALIIDTSFVGILKFKPQKKSAQVRIEKFWHETIGEFLVADTLVEAFKKGGRDLYKFLITVYKNEINIFVRGAFQIMTLDERMKILHNFEDSYFAIFSSNHNLQRIVSLRSSKNLNKRTIEKNVINQTEGALRIREQILYYVGRLQFAFSPKILRFAYYNEPSALLSRIAALGAILHGDEQIERDYLNKFIPRSHTDIENRSVQLVYFGDVDGDINTYLDDCKQPWTRTRSAIYHRLTLNSQRELRLRWWDIKTLNLFYASRNWENSVTKEELEILQNMSIDSDEFSDAKKKEMIKEKNQLIEKLQQRLRRG